MNLNLSPFIYTSLDIVHLPLSLSSTKIHYFSSLSHPLLSLTLHHHSPSSPLLLPLILHLSLHLPPYSHPLTPSTHCYLHSSIIPPISLLPTHIPFYSSPTTLTSITRFLSLSSTFLAIYLIFVIFDQLVFPCPPERCLLQKYTTFSPFFTLTYPSPFFITLYPPLFYYPLFFIYSSIFLLTLILPVLLLIVICILQSFFQIHFSPLTSISILLPSLSLVSSDSSHSPLHS